MWSESWTGENGKLAAKIAQLTGRSDWAAYFPEKCETTLGKWVNRYHVDLSYVLPEPITDKCEECDNHSEVSCSKCDGTCVTTCYSCGHDYECSRCDGSGKEDCTYCDHGKLTRSMHVEDWVSVGDAGYMDSNNTALMLKGFGLDEKVRGSVCKPNLYVLLGTNWVLGIKLEGGNFIMAKFKIDKWDDECATISGKTQKTMSLTDVGEVCHKAPALAVRTWKNLLTDDQIQIVLRSEANPPYWNHALSLDHLETHHVDMLIRRCAPEVAMSHVPLTLEQIQELTSKCPQVLLEYRGSLLSKKQKEACKES